MKENNNDPESLKQLPFTFVVNMIVPCSINLSLLLYFQPASKDWREDGTPMSKLLQNFINNPDDKFRNDRFKLIPRIVKGNMLIKKAVGSRPAVIGNKGLTVPYFKGMFDIFCNSNFCNSNFCDSIFWNSQFFETLNVTLNFLELSMFCNQLHINITN